MARARVRKQIDVRTRTMSVEAITCRTLGHAMTPVPVAVRRRNELRQLGQYLIRTVCMRGCSRWAEKICDEATDEVIASTGGYSDKDTYLVQVKGTGRLPRTAARAAFRKAVGDPSH